MGMLFIAVVDDCETKRQRKYEKKEKKNWFTPSLVGVRFSLLVTSDVSFFSLLLSSLFLAFLSCCCCVVDGSQHSPRMNSVSQSPFFLLEIYLLTLYTLRQLS